MMGVKSPSTQTLYALFNLKSPKKRSENVDDCTDTVSAAENEDKSLRSDFNDPSSTRSDKETRVFYEDFTHENFNNEITSSESIIANEKPRNPIQSFTSNGSSPRSIGSPLSSTSPSLHKPTASSSQPSSMVTLKLSPSRLKVVCMKSFLENPEKEETRIHPFFLDVQERIQKSKDKQKIDKSIEEKDVEIIEEIDVKSASKGSSSVPLHHFFTQVRQQQLKRKSCAQKENIVEILDEDEPVIAPTPASTVKNIAEPHPFFARVREQQTASRNPSEKAAKAQTASRNPSEKAAKTQNQQHSQASSRNSPAPWSIVHVRDTEPNHISRKPNFDSWPSHVTPEGRSKSEHIPSNEMVYSQMMVVPHAQVVRKPENLVMSGNEIRSLAISMIKPENASKLRYLLNSSGDPESFDEQGSAMELWTTKYSPSKVEQILSSNNSAKIVQSWVQEKFKSLKSRRRSRKDDLRRKKRRKNDDFVVSDDEIDEEIKENEPKSRYLILYGPSGSGKTMSVFTAVQELDAYVFEVNSSSRRTGKDVTSLLGGVSQSHLVHTSSTEILKHDTAILIDDVDCLFQDENSIWSALEKFTETARRPMLMTCTDTTVIPENIANEALFVQVLPVEKDLAVDCLLLIALNEGHWLKRDIAEQLWSENDGDLRRAINSLQFWCQKSRVHERDVRKVDEPDVRGKQKVNEPDSRDDQKEQTRISKDTFVNEKKAKHRNSECEDLAHYTDTQNSLSCFDILETNKKSIVKHDFKPSPEDPIGHEKCSEMPLINEPLHFECDIAGYMRQMIHTETHESQIPDNSTISSYIGNLREMFWFLSYSAKTVQATGSTYNSIECSTADVLTTEIAPTIRHIAQSDLKNNDKRQQLLDQNTGSRLTRRSLNSFGFEHCNHFPKETDVESILRTGFVCLDGFICPDESFSVIREG